MQESAREFLHRLNLKLIDCFLISSCQKTNKQSNENVTLLCANKQPLQRWWSWSYIIIRKIGMFAFFVFVLQNSICHHSNCQFWGYEWHSYAQIKCYFLQTKKGPNSLIEWIWWHLNYIFVRYLQSEKSSQFWRRLTVLNKICFKNFCEHYLLCENIQ